MPPRTKAGPVLQGERLRDQIYDFVRGELRHGYLAPGDRVKEVELAERVGVSRTPVREALFQLARDGFLEECNQGYQLPEHTPQELSDRLELRLLLEPSIARHAALDGNARQHLRLKKALDDEAALTGTDDSRRFLVANLRFMEELFAMCRNKLLVRSAQLFADQYQYFRLRTFASHEAREITVARHRELTEAVLAGDGEAAARATRALLETATEYQQTHSAPAAPTGASAGPKRGSSPEPLRRRPS